MSHRVVVRSRHSRESVLNNRVGELVDEGHQVEQGYFKTVYFQTSEADIASDVF